MLEPCNEQELILATDNDKIDYLWYPDYYSKENIENVRGVPRVVISEMLEPFNQPDFEVATDDEISILLT